MTAHSPLAIANSVLEEAWSQDKSLTIMQLLKLVYIAHGWSLGLLNAPLVNEEPEAWQHGPVFPSVYRQFRRFGSAPITELATTPFGPLADAKLTPDQRSVISSVVKNYGDMHAFRLSRITHEPDTPWFNTYDGGRGSSADISNSLIAEHYRKLARERAQAA
jgi:uncharacterized phage-associated protein